MTANVPRDPSNSQEFEEQVKLREVYQARWMMRHALPNLPEA